MLAERYGSLDTAHDVYGVVIVCSIDDDSLAVDETETAAPRSLRRRKLGTCAAKIHGGKYPVFSRFPYVGVR